MLFTNFTLVENTLEFFIYRVCCFTTEAPAAGGPSLLCSTAESVMLSLLEYTHFVETFDPEIRIKLLDNETSLIFLCSSSDFQSAGLWLHFSKLQHDVPQRRQV